MAEVPFDESKHPRDDEGQFSEVTGTKKPEGPKLGKGNGENRTQPKKASQWVKDRLLIRKGDVVLDQILSDKMKQLLADAKVIQTDEAHPTSAVGVARRWEEGGSIKWQEGDIHIALHEMGHAILYQGKHGDKFVSSSLVDQWIPTSERAIAEYQQAKTGEQTPPLLLDTSSVNEMWADVVQAYCNPRSHILLKVTMPETHATMKRLLGHVPYDIEISSRLTEILKAAVDKGHLRKRSDLERYGLTIEKYEQLRELVMPTIQGWDKKYTKSEISQYRDRIQKAEELLSSEKSLSIKSGFSGQIEDSLGRQRCYNQGVLVPCEQVPEQQQEPTPEEQPQTDPRFEQDWQEAVEGELDAQVHEYTPEQVQAEQDWHGQIVQWRAEGGEPSENDAPQATRFLSGLLNPLVGTVEYIDNLVRSYGIPMDESGLAGDILSELDRSNPKGLANAAIAGILAWLFADLGVTVAKSIPSARAEVEQPVIEPSKINEEPQQNAQEGPSLPAAGPLTHPSKPGMEKRREKARKRARAIGRNIAQLTDEERAEKAAKASSRIERRRKGQQKRSDEFWEKENKKKSYSSKSPETEIRVDESDPYSSSIEQTPEWYWQRFQEQKAIQMKDMSWLNSSRGGAIVKPPEFSLRRKVKNVIVKPSRLRK